MKVDAEFPSTQGVPMLDPFHRTHTRVVITKDTHAFITPEGFRVARLAASQPLLSPVRNLFEKFSPIRRHEIFYTLVLEEETMSYGLKFLYDRLLVEVVILFRLMRLEEVDLESDPSIKSSLAVLGWMIQERLIFILLQTGENSFEEIRCMCTFPGLNSGEWGNHLIGACTEAKAMLEVARMDDLTVYPSTAFEDIIMGIDFFAELNGTSAGACVSVKTSLYRTSKCTFGPTRGTGSYWNHIVAGTTTFQTYTSRTWQPALMTLIREKGKHIPVLPSLYTPVWVTQLRRELKTNATEVRVNSA